MAVKLTKPNTILKLIRRRSGATLADLRKATNWQPHSIRAALSKLRKQGNTIVCAESKSRGSFYKAMKG
ncbi:MAG: hypothetical protein COB46_02170 [Rhodospirillaceae bacterium]|nr:MAG: hypothetical protein COB46_02170 [Rhodospirillaceae bacterium]